LTSALVKSRGGSTARVGVYALSLLAVPLNALVLWGLADAPRSLAELRRGAGSPPHTTMRDYLRTLAGAGVVEKHRACGFRGSVGYDLTAAGQDLLEVAGCLAAWLESAPGRPVDLGGLEARNATRALVEGWSTGMVRAVAARPLSLTELDNVISTHNYPSLERRLATMRQLGLMEALSGPGRSTPNGATDWLRQAVAPLIAATRWEHSHRGGDAPLITLRDVEAAFLLSLPLLRLAPQVSGSCRAGVQVGTGNLVGAMVEVTGGRVSACTTDLEGMPDAWALGSTATWISAVVARDARRLELGGDRALATELVEGLSGAVRGVGGTGWGR
jgi:DNA-binding HxlR family transcriptional regulator